MSRRIIIERLMTSFLPHCRHGTVILQRKCTKIPVHCSGKDFSLYNSSASKAVTPQQTVDLLMQNLRSATDTSDVLYSVHQHHSIMNDSHITQALQTVFVLQKSQQSSMTNGELVKHESFILLCKSLQQKIRFLDLKDQLNALKVMSFIGVPSTTKIVQILLQLIVKQVNDLTLQQIVFLDFMLKDFHSCPLVDALKIALPVVFESHFRVQRGGSEIKQLSEFFTYAVKRRLSEKCIDSFVEIINTNRDAINVDTSRIIIRTLCEAKRSEAPYRTLLHQSLDNIIDNIDKISFLDLNYILARLTSNYRRNMSYFYHEEFVNSCADYVVNKRHSDEYATWILKSCNKFKHMHKGLLDYICSIVAENPSVLNGWHDGMFVTLVNGLALSDYRPDNFSVFQNELVSHITSLTNKFELPWLRIALDLCSLDCWPHELFNTIFEENFLNTFLKRDNLEDAFELLLLYQAVTTLCPSYAGNMPSEALMRKVMRKVRQFDSKEPSQLLPALVHGLGGPSYVHSQLSTKMGHFIDHAVVMRKGGYFVSINSSKERSPVMVEDIPVPEDSQMILVLLLTAPHYTVNTERILGHVRLNISTLEAMGYSVVPIMQGVWVNLMDSEKIPYLMRALQTDNKTQENLVALT